MLRSRAMVVAVLVITALVFPTSAAQTAVFGEVKKMSHNHPKLKSYSWVAARVDASNGANVDAHLAGPGVKSVAELKCQARASNDGKLLFVWKIDQAGEYTVHLTTSKSGDSDSDSANYTVPSPPRPRWGEFRFKRNAGCYHGWPTS